MLGSRQERKIEQRRDVTETRVFKWMNGVTKDDKLRNEYIRCSLGVVSIIDKIRENSKRRIGRVLRREEISEGAMNDISEGNVCRRKERKEKIEKEVDECD